MPQDETDTRLSTGVDGLDEILNSGFIPGRGYLIRGGPGTGKTMFGLRFLEQGVEEGETCLLITLEETAQDLAANAAGIGISLEGIEVLDLSTDPEAFRPGGTYDVFSPEEVEGDDVSEQILDRLHEVEPDRVFLDPMTLIRHLTPDPYQFRKQVLGLTRTIRDVGATLVLTSQPASEEPDQDLQFVTDGSILLGWRDQFRTIHVPKFRGSKTQSGPHTFRIEASGIQVFPRLFPNERKANHLGEQLSSGVDTLDDLLHGGLERGTATIISGPTGVGKTTLGTQFMKEAASRGERSSIYLFEENQETFLSRNEAIGTPVGGMVEKGMLTIQEIEALTRSPEELAQMMRDDVEDNGVGIVMIDGVAGFRIATGGDTAALMPKLHALVRYLKNEGVTVLLIDEITQNEAGFKATEGHVSYLADNVVFLRHIELDGELRKIIGVLKKRVSDFERQIRRFEITGEGIQVGDPMRGMRGVLTGVPEMATQSRS